MHIYKKKDQYEENFKFQLINKQRYRIFILIIFRIYY